MFDFTETDVPTLTRNRTREANPFDEPVSAMRIGGAAKSFTMPGTAEKVPSKSGKTESYEDVNLARVMRQLTEAGNAENVTVRRTVEDDLRGTLTITFWLVEKITRNVTKGEGDEEYDEGDVGEEL